MKTFQRFLKELLAVSKVDSTKTDAVIDTAAEQTTTAVTNGVKTIFKAIKVVAPAMNQIAEQWDEDQEKVNRAVIDMQIAVAKNLNA